VDHVHVSQLIGADELAIAGSGCRRDPHLRLELSQGHDLECSVQRVLGQRMGAHRDAASLHVLDELVGGVCDT